MNTNCRIFNFAKFDVKIYLFTVTIIMDKKFDINIVIGDKFDLFSIKIIETMYLPSRP